METRIPLPAEAIRDYCRRQTIRDSCCRQPIRRLSVFGSVLRDDFSAESDIDLLVEYVPGVPVTLIDMAQQEIDLGAIIGHRVDVRTTADLSPYFRRAVIDVARLIYEHG